jgi:hypothetical protein
MLFKKGLKVDNRKASKIVNNMVGKYNPPNKEDYKLGRRMEDDDND